MKKIILCGYMASGKTTVAQLLAAASGLPFLDLDQVIEQKYSKTIPQLFNEGGEINFRKKEHLALKDIAEGNEPFTLALGGGTPCYANNHLFLQRKDIISVYLKASVPTIIERLRTDDTERPLLRGLHGDALAEYIGQHLFERSWYYMQAKHIVNTSGKSANEVVNEVMSLF